MKYAPGLMVGQLSGSTGSTTASRGRFGSYFRSRTIPTNPNSTSQQGVRGIFGGLSQAWRALSESQRLAWNALAEQIAKVDSLGVQYFQTGAQLYVGTNVKRDAVGDAALSDAPALDSAPTVVSYSVTADATVGGTIEIDLGAVISGGTASNNVIVSASAPRSAGRTYVSRSELKQITTFPGNQSFVAALDITAAYEAVFGAGWALQDGMELVVRLDPVSENGFGGTPVDVQTTIV